MKYNSKPFRIVALILIGLSSCNQDKLLQETVFSPAKTSSLQENLTKQQAYSLIEKADSLEKEKDKGLSVGWSSKQFSQNGKTMKFETTTYGSKPSDGRSLYISMHGGGATTASVNDQQWKNQIQMTSDSPQLYNIKEGVVVVPRAPVDDWNMWFQYEIDDLFENIIRSAVLFADVNPNKVYIMGYSAGGDGTFRLASRMADHWAAASMSAGHPGEVTPVNLRNIGFALNMGGLDNAFNRNGLAREWKKQLEDLAAANPGQYQHQVNIFESYPHWMNMEDRVAIPFMAGFKRNPYPNRIDWMQNSFRLRNRFYWIGISNADMAKPDIANSVANTISINKNKNIIEIENNYAEEFYIYLNDKVADLDQNIIVRYRGTEIFNGQAIRKESIINQTAAERGDSDYIFSAKLIVKNNQTVEQTD